MTRTVWLPRPRTAYQPRPELWEVEGKLYLVYAPFVVTSPVVAHGARHDGAYYECTTRHTVYRVEWAPTWRAATVARLRLHRRWVKTGLPTA